MHTPRMCYCHPGRESSERRIRRISRLASEGGGSVQEVLDRAREALDAVAHFHTPGGVPMKENGGYPVLPFRPGKTRR